jgi:hypothetical protein|tara:strand:+ start:16291 stop:16407 length:117 start_codon:yes stop_codon:yes gene_type:complete
MRLKRNQEAEYEGRSDDVKDQRKKIQDTKNTSIGKVLN